MSILIIDEDTKTVTASFNEKNVICKTKLLAILLVFLLITIELLIIIIYCYLIKHKRKQKHLFPFYITNSKLKEV